MISRVNAYFRSLVHNFGYHFVLVLISTYGGLKGATTQLVGNATLPYFQKMNITGEGYQSFGTVASTPWSMKAAIGLLSDAVPLFGYHKRAYIVLVSIIGTIALAILGTVQLPPELARVAAILLLVVNLQIATVDLLTEGKYAELMVKSPETGSDLVSFVWGMFSVGTLIGSIVSGPMADNVAPRWIFFVGIFTAAQVIFPTIRGWFPETRLPEGERGIRYDKLSEHPNLVKLSIAMTIGALVVGLSALGSGTIQSILSVCVAVFLAILGFVWLPKTLRCANLYLFLNNVLYLSISGAMDYWFIAKEECVADGPSFSFTFYNTWANLVGSVASVAGVSLFQRFLSRGKFRVAFWSTGLIKLAASMFDYAIVMRYNKRIHIPDKVFFMMGDAIIVQVVGMLELMPAVVLTSKVCPPGMEASVYALLASYQNLGGNVARTIGVALIERLQIRTTVPCNFDGLPKAILIAHVILPALSFPLVFLLIPDARMTDDLIDAAETRGADQFEPVPLEDPGDDDSDDTDSRDMDRGTEAMLNASMPNDDIPGEMAEIVAMGDFETRKEEDTQKQTESETEIVENDTEEVRSEPSEEGDLDTENSNRVR